MDSVVLPSSALLNTNTSPLSFSQGSVLGQTSHTFLGKNHMTVLVLSILVLFGVIDLELEKRPNNSSFLHITYTHTLAVAILDN